MEKRTLGGLVAGASNQYQGAGANVPLNRTSCDYMFATYLATVNPQGFEHLDVEYLGDLYKSFIGLTALTAQVWDQHMANIAGGGIQQQQFGKIGQQSRVA